MMKVCWRNGALSVGVVALLLAMCAGQASVRTHKEITFGNGGLVKGPRTVENVKENMERMLPRLYYLFAEARGPDSSMEGTVHVRMEIDGNGRAGYVGIHATTLDREGFEDLLVAAIAESRFDEWTQGRGVTEIVYPIYFTDARADEAPKSRDRRIWEQRRKLMRKQRDEDSAAALEPAMDEWERYESGE
jgi:hypothetical protein